jgi:thymidylate synthase
MTKFNQADEAYFNVIDTIAKYGEEHNDRTGVGTKRIFGVMFKFDLMESFPIITCKKASFTNTLSELIWFISGSTNVNDLVNINPKAEKWWRPFQLDEKGNLGPMYGKQWTNFNGQDFNQLDTLISKIKEDKNSRRILLTSYNPLEADQGALYPCHSLATQFMVGIDGRLHMSTLSRSMDFALGAPANWISYALLQIMICVLTGYTPGVLTYFVNDLHIYNNHLNALINMERKSYSQPQVEVDDNIKSIYDFNMDSFKLLNYKSGPFIKLPMAV